MNVVCFLSILELKANTILYLIYRYGLLLDEMSPGQSGGSETSSTSCPTNIFACDPNARYRTADGSCNNIKTPSLGMSFRPQARFLQPDYGNGK